MRSRIILLVVFVVFVFSATAQKLTLGFLFPAGGEKGSVVEVEAGGLNLNKATKVVFSHPGIQGSLIPVVENKSDVAKRKKLNDQSSPQLADRVRIKVSISEDVPVGLYDFRLQSAQGISNKLPFEVSQYPNFVESGKSNLKEPDIVENIPSVLCGQVTPGGIDYFRFKGRKGETIVASVKGRLLVPYIADAVPGWFQPVVKIIDSKGKEVAYSDDYRHYVDPLIIVKLPADDYYTLSIHDAIFRGRQDFNYRIQLGAIPYVVGAYPSYGLVGRKVKQTLSGVNLSTSSATVKPEKEGYQTFSYKMKNGTTNHTSFYSIPKSIRYIAFPKDAGTTLNVDCAISDSLTSHDKIKNYKIPVKKNQQVIIELIGRRNASMLDAVMKLKDDAGRILAEADDTEDPVQGLITFHADPVLKYMPKKSAVLTLEVEDLQGGYGRDYHYLLRRHNQMPSFNAFVSPANISIPSGGTSSFHVDIKGKLKRPASLELRGLPDGYVTSSMQLSGGKGWDVSITSPKEASLGGIPVELFVKYSGSGGKDVYSAVLPVDNMMQAFYYTHHISASELKVEITEASPYRITAEVNNEIPVSLSDSLLAIKVKVDKDVNFNDTIDLELGKKVKQFTLEPVSILPNETEKVIYIKVDKSFTSKFKGKKFLPSWQMSIVGTVKGEIVKQGKRTFQNAKYREMTPYFLIKLKDEKF